MVNLLNAFTEVVLLFWPVIQDFAYLDLKPISIEANLTNALSRQNIRVDITL